MTSCRIYAGKTNAAGYARRVLPDLNGKRRYQMLHRWVVEQAEGVPLKPWPEEIVMHTCDTPGCFLYEHLRRATPGENNQDAIAKGRAMRWRGEEHHNAKLTQERADAIRRRRAEGTTYSALASEFDVSQTLIAKVIRGEIWTATCPNPKSHRRSR